MSTKSPKTRLVWRSLALIMALMIVTLVTIRFWPRQPLSTLAPSSTAVFSADGKLLRLNLATDQQYRVWTPLPRLSKTLVDAVLLQEDRWFYWHAGINPYSLARGAFKTYAADSRQGGSTITMQLARLAYHLNTRTPWGKLRQIAYALSLEARYSKHEILEAYLNLAPYGRNVQGAGAASLIYFGKTPDQLTLAEALTLAVIPQQPKLRGGTASESISLAGARQRLFARWQNHFDATETERRLVALPIPLRTLQQLPFKAPHFVEMLLAEHPGANTLRSTLDLALQEQLENQIERYLTQRRALGVRNAVALLLDPKDMAVKAWVGSANYFDAEIDGQVNGVIAKRSPGSTLKPFIYGMGLDQGLLHPRTILKDAPTAFGAFSPENFDGRFVGPITAQDALIHSRNIPAVWVASQLKQPSLYQFLQSAGISQLQSESHYGLALVLGGGEVTMEELVRLYAVLVNKGQLNPVRTLQTEALPSHGIPLLSEQASFIVLDMLAHNPRPDAETSFAASNRQPSSWKTGTSWGFRDAWTVGTVGPYVLAVWVGNFDGASNPEFVGIQTAAPLFFRIADGVNLLNKQPLLPRRPPQGIKRVAVCAASGDLPNTWCPQTALTWYIPGKSPIRVSTLHRPVIINTSTGQLACPPYDPANTRQEIYEFWTSDMQRLFREAGMPRRAPPQSAGCQNNAEAEGDLPHISSPYRGVTYTLRNSKPDEAIALQATAAADVRELFWFSGKRFIGRTDAKIALRWRPEEVGWHPLRVVDDHGRAAERDVKIEMVE